MTIEEICKVLDQNDIQYRIYECADGTKLVYVDYGCYGYPNGLKTKKFRPDFRISESGYLDDRTVYVKDCGYCSYMCMDEALRLIKESRFDF